MRMNIMTNSPSYQMISVFDLSYKVNGVHRSCKAINHTGLINEVSFLAFIAEKINRQPPTELEIFVRYFNSRNEDYPSYYAITVSLNGKPAERYTTKDVLEVEKELTSAVNKTFSAFNRLYQTIKV